MPKVKVRIAVAVDAGGDWNSAGWASGSDDDKMGIACETVANGEARYWLEAELDVPNAVVVEATVTPNAEITGGPLAARPVD